ncbi:hypothetical protein D3C75_1244690 [compost metagenome]
MEAAGFERHFPFCRHLDALHLAHLHDAILVQMGVQLGTARVRGGYRSQGHRLVRVILEHHEGRRVGRTRGEQAHITVDGLDLGQRGGGQEQGQAGIKRTFKHG